MKILTQTSDDLRALAARLETETEFGFDTEDTASDEDHARNPDSVFDWDCTLLCGFSFGFQNGDKTYVPLTHDSGKNAPWDESLALLRKVMEDPSKTVWAHNWQFDLIPLLNNGIEPKAQLRCTAVLCGLLLKRIFRGKGGATLKALSKKYLAYVMTEILDLMPEGSRFHETNINDAAKYASDDAVQALRLGLLWMPELEAQEMTQVYLKIEMPTVRVLRHMNDVGHELDRDYIRELRGVWEEECNRLKKEFSVLTGGLSITSTQQISDFMYDEVRWWPTEGFDRGKGTKNKEEGRYSTDIKHRDKVRVMLRRDTKRPPAVIEKGLRALDIKDGHAVLYKLLTTYTTSLITQADRWKDGRPRSNMKQDIAITGRFSSSDPNLQNIPVRSEEGAKIRQAFISKPGWKLCLGDYSQVELRIIAHLSRDPMLMKAYKEGIDVHQQTADETGTDRKMGKVTNLGLIYEMGVGTLANNLGCSDTRAGNIHRAWHKTYRQIAKYHKRQHRFASQHGYVTTITGRRIPIEQDWINGTAFGRRAAAQRNSSNYPCQGSSADMMKLAMKDFLAWGMRKNLMFCPRTGYGSIKMVNTVHDELVVEAKEEVVDLVLVKMKHYMENCVKLSVPLVVEPNVADNWREAK